MAERRWSIFREEYSKRHLLFWRYGVLVKMEEQATYFCLVSGFAPNVIQNAARLRRIMSSSETETVCDRLEGAVDVHDLISQKGSGKLIRSAILSNVNGDIVRLEDEMGQGTSLVIFLRHLA